MTQTDIALLTQKLEHLQEKIELLHDMILDHISKEESQWEKLNKQIEKDYARKWVEIVVWFCIFAVGTSLIGWVITQQSTINEHIIQTKTIQNKQ